MPTRVPRRTPASLPHQCLEDASSNSSASPKDLSTLVSHGGDCNSLILTIYFRYSQPEYQRLFRATASSTTLDTHNQSIRDSSELQLVQLLQILATRVSETLPSNSQFNYSRYSQPEYQRLFRATASSITLDTRNQSIRDSPDLLLQILQLGLIGGPLEIQSK